MPPDVTGPDLLQRAKAIRLPLTDIAREASLNKHTIGSLRHGKPGVRVSTLRQVAAVIERHERETLAHLIDLHGLPVARKDAA